MSLFLGGEFQGLDDNGDPLAGGKVYFYEPGTSTLKDTYTDSTLATPNTNPVILDANGRGAIWLDGSYKVVLNTSADVLVYEEDNINSNNTGYSVLLYPTNVTVATTGNATKIQFHAEDHDDIGSHDNVTNNERITIPNGSTISKIRLSACVQWTDINTTGFRAIDIIKNGNTNLTVAIMQVPPGGSGVEMEYMIISPVINVTQNDYFELRFWHNAGSSLTVKTSYPTFTTGTWFSLEVVK